MPEGKKWSPEAAEKRLLKLELTNEERAERIRELVTKTSNAYIPVTVQGIVFIVRPAIPRKTRMKIDEALKLTASKEVTLAQVEELSYQIGAELCLEPPWNDVEGWKQFDNESGMAIKVIQEIAEAVMTSEEEIRYFRRE